MDQPTFADIRAEEAQDAAGMGVGGRQDIRGLVGCGVRWETGVWVAGMTGVRRE